MCTMHVVVPSSTGCFADLIMEGSSHWVPANLGCTSTKLRPTRTAVIPPAASSSSFYANIGCTEGGPAAIQLLQV